MNNHKHLCFLSLTFITSFFSCSSPGQSSRLNYLFTKSTPHNPLWSPLSFISTCSKSTQINWKRHEAVRTCHKIQHKDHSIQENHIFTCWHTTSLPVFWWWHCWLTSPMNSNKSGETTKESSVISNCASCSGIGFVFTLLPNAEERDLLSLTDFLLPSK